MTVEQALGLIALLLALWAIHWARRAANASERAAAAAEKIELAANRSALAAKRWAEASLAGAPASATAESGAQDGASDEPLPFDALVKELMASWAEAKTALPFIERHPELPEAEARRVVEKAFYFMGRDEAEAKQHAQAVLNFHRAHQTHAA